MSGILNRENFECKECFKSFQSKSSLNNHRSDVHVNIEEKTCKFCQIIFSWVFPKYIREGSVYQYLKIEHAGENIHCKYNRLERKHQNQKHRGTIFQKKE